ncbi:cytidylyltransferase domain-containing protein [Candidatus Margulisiibacteriota bacterium]
MKKEIMCLILARGRSKRVPRKNIRELAGKPLIAYTIECAKQSKYINRIIVSTDDQEIAAVAREYRAEIPFLRPAEISQEDSTELDAFKHALEWLKENERYQPDIIVKLFATSPFRTTQSVDKAIELLLKNPDADSVRSVTLCSEHPYKMWTITGDQLRHFIPPEKKPREAHTLSYQVLPKVYIQNASIDVIRPDNIWTKESITGEKIIPFVMGEIESVDINMPIDFELAEILLEKETIEE